VTPASLVRKLRAEDRQDVAALLARAFDDDPLATYIFPDNRVRARGLRRFFDIQLRAMFLGAGESHGAALDGGGGLRAAALWLPPGRPAAGLGAVLRLVPLLRYTGRRTARTLRLLGAVDAKHPRAPHYYLGVLGTDPPVQGQGLGSAVMAPVLERCDAEGLPAYLESSKERNVPFYRRHGFEVVDELHVAGAPPLWLMWREPHPPGAG